MHLSSGLNYVILLAPASHIAIITEDVVYTFSELHDLEENVIAPHRLENGDLFHCKIGANVDHRLENKEAMNLMILGDTYSLFCSTTTGYGRTGLSVIEHETIFQIGLKMVNAQQESAIDEDEIIGIQTYTLSDKLNLANYIALASIVVIPNSDTRIPPYVPLIFA